MRPVTVFTTFSSGEANLICSRLNAAGLHAQVAHELSALSIEGYSLGAQGIAVQVPDDEAEQARELIDNPGTPLDEPPPNP
ncbi:MAG: DUF2007 domain-containing protein [Verrucomicrobia bacterium]|nr:DUF2007 domain-containing protein [Verrucomicrobiota bacterium]